MCVCVGAHMQMFYCLCVCVCACAHASACVCVCACARACVCVCVCVRACVACVCKGGGVRSIIQHFTMFASLTSEKTARCGSPVHMKNRPDEEVFVWENKGLR